MELGLLGTLQYNGRAVQIPRKARVLLAYVAARGQRHRRDELSALLCASAVDPRRTLRTLLSHIRSHYPGLLATEGEYVALGEAVWVDCHVFSRAVRRGAIAAGTLALYREEFLAGEELPDSPEFEMWLLGRRVHYKMLHEKALLDMAREQFARGELKAARGYAARLVESNPYGEEGQALLIELLAASGDLAGAREQRARFRSLLQRELDVLPTPAFEEQATAALSAQPRATAPPVESAAEAAASGARDYASPRQTLLFDQSRLQERLGGGELTQWAQLQQWALRTAEMARSISAHPDAAAALDTALLAAEKTGARPQERARILLERLLVAADLDEPLERQRERLEQAEALLDAAETAPPVQLELARATVNYRLARYVRAEAAAARAAELLHAAGETALAGWARVIEGKSLLRAGKNRAAARALEAARPWLADGGDEEGLSQCLGVRAWASINLGQIEEAFAFVEEGLAHLGPASPPAAEARLAYTLAACWNYYYDPAGMERSGRRAIELYEKAGKPALAARTEIYLLQADRYRFRHEVTQHRLGSLFQKAQQHHDTWLLAWSMALLGQAAFRQGRLTEAKYWYGRAYGLRQRTGERQNQVYDLAWTGRLRAALGRPGSALHYTAAAVRQMEADAGDYVPWEPWDIYLAHAEALWQNGRQEEVVATVEAGHRALQTFATQIPAGSLRRQVLNFEHSRCLLAAHESGQIVPFHQREHKII